MNEVSIIMLVDIILVVVLAFSALFVVKFLTKE